jgi:signal transduction histidine kinase/ligand-binding sensor domain-containing protein/AraC-like DNA-binding protein
MAIKVHIVFGLVIFLLLLISNISSSQNQKISIEHFEIERGMSYDERLVFSICQDQKGFLWFATQNGLDRYDGYSFASFKYPLNSKLLGEKEPGTIAEDMQGNIWVASLNGGIEKFDTEKQTFKNYIPDTSKPQTDFANSVYEVFIDRNDMIWLGTGYGLHIFNKENETFTTFRYSEKDSSSLGHNSINGIYEDKSGTIWLATGGGLDRYDREENKFYHYWHYPNNPWGDPKTNIYWLQQIIEDGDSVLWIGSDGGLLMFNKKTEKIFLFHRDKSTIEGKNKSVIRSLCKDSSGRIWLGTSTGIDFFDKRTNTFVNFRPEERIFEYLDKEPILSLLFDKSGLLWIASSSNGIYKVNFPDPSFNNYIQNLGNGKEFSLDGVLYFWEEKDGNIWVCTTKGYGQLDLMKNRILDSYTFSNIRVVWKVIDDLWILPLAGGLYKLDIKKNKWECYIDSVETPYEYVFRSIFLGNDGTCWLGNYLGEFFSLNLKSKKIENITKIKGHIYAIYQDSYGLVWFGGFTTGLFCYDPRTNLIQEYTSDPNDSTTIIDDNFYSYCEDKNGTLWLGCLTGIVRYNRSENNFTRFYGNNDFMKGIVKHILEDDNGNLWIGTENGITKFNPTTGQFKDYYSSKYFPEITFSRLVGYKASNGEMYFGGENGFIRFHPDSVKEETFIPPIAITGFKKFEKYYPFGKEIELMHDDNFLTFEFAALSYLNSAENQYAYMMEGIDRDWVYCGTRRFASYPNLSPGEYIFRVKGSDCNRVWNEAGTSIKITIFPPWWATTWAYIIYAFFILSVIYFTWKLQLKRVRNKHELEMTKFEAEKMHEVDELKSRFFANISHEFRTPLTLILGLAKKIVDKTKETTSREDAGVIKRNADRLHGLVNQLLDLSKLESGNMTLQTSSINLIPLLKGLVLSFASFAERKRITLKFNSDEEEIVAYIDKDKIEKIVINLLSNAFKFTPQGGKIEFDVIRTDKNIEISVSDTGIGMSPDRIEKIFDRFYQVDSSHTREQEGTGLGLALTKELVELHKGKIRVESSEGKGSTFTVTLPLGKDHLKPEETIESKSEEVEKTVPEELDLGYEYEVNKVKSSVEKLSEEETLLLLIVEDNADVRNYIKGNLEEDFRILEVEDGEDGLNQSINHIPDLIISDVMMPKMDGFEMCDKLKNDERTSHIPVIMLTAKATDKDKIDGYKTGADDYIMKPFDTEVLRARINNLIQQRDRLREHFKKEGIFQIDDTNVTPTDKIFLTKALDIINKHLSDESFSVDVFANEIAMSRSQLGRKLVALVGESPGDLIRRIRLTKAAKLIEENFGNISEIAAEVGFNNPSNFARSFKTQFGVSPSDYLSSKK